jgi:Trimethylamine methyltransferase (MTTB)
VNQEATQHARKPARSVPIGGNGISLGDNGFALEAFREIGPGRHYLGSAHTLAKYQTAFYDFELADNNSFEQWSAEGGRDQMHGRCRTSSAETPAPPANSRKINLLPLRGLATRVFTLPCDRGYPDACTAGSCYLSLCRAGGSGRQAGCALGESHAE